MFLHRTTLRYVIEESTNVMFLHRTTLLYIQEDNINVTCFVFKTPVNLSFGLQVLELCHVQVTFT
jgi:hypothetical protein